MRPLEKSEEELTQLESRLDAEIGGFLSMLALETNTGCHEHRTVSRRAQKGWKFIQEDL